jgi:hypothetical protein
MQCGVGFVASACIDGVGSWEGCLSHEVSDSIDVNVVYHFKFLSILVSMFLFVWFSGILRAFL